MGFGGMAAAIQSELVPALKAANEQAATLIERTRTARDEQREMSKQLAALMSGSGQAGDFASEGFAFDDKDGRDSGAPDVGKMDWAAGKSGGFISIKYANELLQQYIGWMEKSKTQWQEAVRITGPGIQESMHNLENIFMKIFPQLGSLENLAREYIKGVQNGAEQVAAETARALEQIAAVAAVSGGAAFIDTVSSEQHDLAAAKDEIDAIAKKVQEIRNELADDELLADARTAVAKIGESLEDLRRDLDEDPISQKLLSDLDAISRKRSELRKAPSLDLRSAQLDVRDVAHRIEALDARLKVERDVVRLAELKRERQQLEQGLADAQKRLAELKKREEQAAGSVEDLAIELERLEIAETRRRLELEARQSDTLATIKDLEKQRSMAQKQIDAQERDAKRRIDDLTRREQELRRTLAKAEDDLLEQSAAKVARVQESVGAIEQLISSRLVPQIGRLESAASDFVASATGSTKSVIAEAANAQSKIEAAAVAALSVTALRTPAVSRQPPSAQVPRSPGLPPATTGLTRPAANPATGRP